MAYVDIEKVLETAKNEYHSDFGRSMADLTSLREVLEYTPAADVVEVVRCKDCEYCICYTNHYGNVSDSYRCKYGNNCCDEDYYCRYGKRKDKNNEK